MLPYRLLCELLPIFYLIAPLTTFSRGQTLTTFILQLTGTGFGNVYGLIILSIFHNRGGYTYNPYGLAAFLAIWAALTSYVFYLTPKFYSFGLLAMNGAGTLVILEYLHNTIVSGPYEEPALRAGQYSERLHM